jgi:RecB family exonuclease
MALDKYRLRARAYSPTALEDLAACPYRFALRSIYKLRPAEHAAEPQRMDPVVRGQLFHQVQTEFLRELKAAGELPVREVTSAVEQRLSGTLDRLAAALAERLAPAIPGVWAAEVARMRIDLGGWLRQMAADTDWTPLHMEWSFGLPDTAGRDPESRSEAVEVLEGYKLSGSVDLIEQDSTGVLRSVDFKTGAPPQPAPESIGKGEVLQPLLYSLAMEQAFGQKTAGGRLSYATLRQNYRTIDVPLNEFARSRARTVLAAIDGALERGFLPAAPREKACEHCDYHEVCGPYEEERTRRKPRPDLKELLEIRRIK